MGNIEEGQMDLASHMAYIEEKLNSVKLGYEEMYSKFTDDSPGAAKETIDELVEHSENNAWRR